MQVALRVVATVVGCCLAAFAGLYCFMLTISVPWMLAGQSTARQTLSLAGGLVCIVISLNGGLCVCALIVHLVWGDVMSFRSRPDARDVL